MNTSDNIAKLGELVATAKTILVLQPDSPDGDSLGSALGLEEVLGDLGKTVVMFAYKEPEPYLRGNEGWDRVSQSWPKQYDFTILVDTGSPALIKATLEHYHSELVSKPVVIIDHHYLSRTDFGFPTIDIIAQDCAAAETVTQICLDLGWPINEQAAAKLATAILSDSLNLTTPYTTAHSVEMLAELVRDGANLHNLYRQKRELSALSPELLHLKGQLLSSVEFFCDGKLALTEIPPEMVHRYKDVYEPYSLVLNEMQWVKGVELVAIFKNYGTKINVPLRSGTGVASQVAERFGGGGHASASAYRCATTDYPAEKQKLIDAFTLFLEEQHATP